MTQSASLQRALTKKRRRIGIILLGLLLFLTFMARTLFGESGVLVGLQVKSEYKRLETETASIAAENQQMRQDIHDLKTDTRKMEAIGRAEFGFAKPNEVVFEFPPSDSQETKQQAGHPD